MTLALLLMAVTGTWAQDVTWNVSDISTAVGGNMGENEPYTKDGITMKFVKIEVGGSCTIGQNIEIWGGSGVLEFTAPEGMKFTKIVINGSGSQAFGYWNKVKYGDGYADGVYSLTWEGEPAEVVTTSSTTGSWDLSVSNASTIEFTFESTLDFTWDAKTKTGYFTMPTYDVELTPVYAPAAKWATDGDKVLAPTAIEGIIAGTEDAIVNAGTVVEGQGTVMYFATTDAEMTAEKAAKAEGWLSTLPTAAGYDDAQTVYVWYYIKGADTPDGQTASAENTFNDSEICAEPIKVEVLSNKFDIALKAANANTIEAGKATVKVGETAAEVKEGKLTGVKMGSKVTITAKDGYKFRKVEATKTVNMLYIEASNHKLYYMEGETWRQAINNHTDLNQGWQYGGMEVWFGNIVNVLKGNGAAVDPGSVIDPTKTYTL
jgi:predicted enzyme related to lactoylglutathione lyase